MLTLIHKLIRAHKLNQAERRYHKAVADHMVREMKSHERMMRQAGHRHLVSPLTND